MCFAPSHRVRHKPVAQFGRPLFRIPDLLVLRTASGTGSHSVVGTQPYTTRAMAWAMAAVAWAGPNLARKQR